MNACARVTLKYSLNYCGDDAYKTATAFSTYARHVHEQIQVESRRVSWRDLAKRPSFMQVLEKLLRGSGTDGQDQGLGPPERKTARQMITIPTLE